MFDPAGCLFGRGFGRAGSRETDEVSDEGIGYLLNNPASKSTTSRCAGSAPTVRAGWRVALCDQAPCGSNRATSVPLSGRARNSFVFLRARRVRSLYAPLTVSTQKGYTLGPVVQGKSLLYSGSHRS